MNRSTEPTLNRTNGIYGIVQKQLNDYNGIFMELTTTGNSSDNPYPSKIEQLFNANMKSTDQMLVQKKL